MEEGRKRRLALLRRRFAAFSKAEIATLAAAADLMLRAAAE
jgi:hypothetical protein